MPDRNGTSCELLTGTLVVWSDGQQGSGCTVTEVFVGASDGDCWFDDPYFKTAFADVCIPSECFCDAVEIYAMGREPEAMSRMVSVLTSWASDLAVAQGQWLRGAPLY